MGAAMVAATVVLLTSTSLAAKSAGSSKSAPIRCRPNHVCCRSLHDSAAD
jgi:hypothetical protein